jgi:hypothetical protein
MILGNIIISLYKGLPRVGLQKGSSGIKNTKLQSRTPDVQGLGDTTETYAIS